MDDKQKLILEGAVKLFKQYGLRSVSMDDVSRSLGMSKKTLYQFVDNKDDLVTRAIDYVIERNSQIDTSDESLNAIDVLLDISRCISAETLEINPVVRYDLFKYFPAIYNAALNKRREHIYRDILANYKNGVKQGLYREDIDIDVVAKLYIKNLMEIHQADFINAPFSKILKVMFDSHIRSIINDKGLEYYEQKIKSHDL